MKRNDFVNRAAWRTAMAQQRIKDRKRIDDLRESVADDMTTRILHPTKGFRRIAGRRVEAQAKLPFFVVRWAQIAAAVQ